MTRLSEREAFRPRTGIQAVVATLALLPWFALAASVPLANAPLATTSTNSEVLPNLMIVFDDSGTMDYDYMPDWANSSDYKKMTGAYNTLYYDPATTYSPPAFFNADGSVDTTTYPSWTGGSTSTGASSSLAYPNWAKVKTNPYSSTSTTDLTSTTRQAYVAIPGEYCSDVKLTTCQATETSTYKYPAPLRWCSTAGNATAATPAAGTCQAVRKTGYTNARMPAPRTTTLSVTSVANGAKVSSLKVDGKEILSAEVTSSSAIQAEMAQKIVDGINACNGIVTGQCTVAGFAATLSGSTITITAGKGTLGTPVVVQTGTFTFTTGNFSTNPYPGYLLLRIINPGSAAVYPYPGASAKGSKRTDCVTNATYCTGNEEMTNYANWFSYYKKRTQSMKTAISLAFKSIDARYRIGITAQSYSGTTDGLGDFLHIDKYETAHKNLFLRTLFAMGTDAWTPTRSALAKVGKIYAGKLGADPMQYSCQKNYAFVATDGYWNADQDYGSPWGLPTSTTTTTITWCRYSNLTSCQAVKTSTYKYQKTTTSTSTTSESIGDMDAAPTSLPYLDTKGASNTLADIARYYSVKDIRTKSLGNCRGGVLPDGTTRTSAQDDDTQGVCPNDFGQQRMTTFSLGLGVDGTLQYTSDYLSATTGDYADLKNGTGTASWPTPLANDPTAIDDLWHAAVNSDGLYFSARSPTEVVASLRDALGQIDKKVGSGAAAAASALQPTPGDNYFYVASYTTVDWTGNLEARSVNLTTGVTAENATWCVENVVEDSCSSPGVATSVTEGSSTSWVCRTTVDGVNTDVPMAKSCTGTLPSRVSSTTDTRTIKMSSGSALQDFSYDNIVARGLNAHYDNAWLRANLSQNATLSADQMAALNGPKLVNYLRGNYGYDMRSSNSVVNRLFRIRAAVLGDIVDSQPAYISKPTMYYVDAGYSAFKTAQAGRVGTVYVGANDGMLHAFNGTNGAERWAFVPTPVIPNLWRLADAMYSTNHRYYANGAPAISSICTANCTSDTAVWRTILVAGLNGGGRGYYALDVTAPDSPILLWEFTADNDSDLGFTYGNPIVTKKSDGTWVVLVTSGYNNGTGSGAWDTSTTPATEVANSPAGTGQGYLFVLKADTGERLAKISTGVGTPATPSGLAKISAWADQPTKNNTATYTYGGDLLGNLWRFDINAGTVMKFATLKDADGVAQPITVRPELGKVNGKRMVYVGTGKYIEKNDTDSAYFKQQTLYAIMDADATATLTDPRGSLVQQIQTNNGTSRTTTSNTVDYSAKRGWYVDFADAGERQNVDGILESGTLITPTTVPTASVCSPGGYSWLNYVNYKTGGVVTGATNAGFKLLSPIVGLNIMYLSNNPDGGGLKPVLSVVTADNPTPTVMPGVPFGSGGAAFSKKKVIWRELIQ